MRAFGETQSKKKGNVCAQRLTCFCFWPRAKKFVPWLLGLKKATWQFAEVLVSNRTKIFQINEDRIFERIGAFFGTSPKNLGESRGNSGNLGEISGESRGNLGESRGFSGESRGISGNLGETRGKLGETWGKLGESRGISRNLGESRGQLGETWGKLGGNLGKLRGTLREFCWSAKGLKPGKFFEWGFRKRMGPY